MLDEAMDEKGLNSSLNFLFFWGCGSKRKIQKGCLSQWWPCKFIIDGIEYNSAEQYMMAEKARVFNDNENLDAILKSSSPKDIKTFGRAVKNFNPSIWNKVKFDIVVKGNIAKFSQNNDLKQFLISTGDMELVEASPKDYIWGIGLSEDDPRALDKSQWLGQNLLGKALMVVREKIKFNQLNETLVDDIEDVSNRIYLSRIDTEKDKSFSVSRPYFCNYDLKRTDWYIESKHASANNTNNTVDIICIKNGINIFDLTSKEDWIHLDKDLDGVELIFQKGEPYFVFNTRIRKNWELMPKEFKQTCRSILEELYIKNQKKYKLTDTFKNNLESINNFTSMFLDVAEETDVLAAINNIIATNANNSLIIAYAKLFKKIKAWNKILNTSDNDKGTYADRLQLILFSQIAAKNFHGFYCKELDRDSKVPMWPTLALFSLEKNISKINHKMIIDNEEYIDDGNIFTMSLQEYQTAREYFKYNQNSNNNSDIEHVKIKKYIKEKRQNDKIAKIKTKEITDEKAKAEAEWKAKIAAAKDAEIIRYKAEAEKAKAEVEKVKVERNAQIRNNYEKWCKDANPKIWNVLFEHTWNPKIKYGLFVVGGNKIQAKKLAEDFCKKQFYSNPKCFLHSKDDKSENAEPILGSSVVIDSTAQFKTRYDQLFNVALIPTYIQYQYIEYILSDYQNFSNDNIWYKYISTYDQEHKKKYMEKKSFNGCIVLII